MKAKSKKRVDIMLIEVGVFVLIAVTPLLNYNRIMASLPLISQAEAEEYKKHDFATNIAPYISLTNNYNNSLKALITSADVLPNGYTFANIPDGLGAARNNSNVIDIFVNHELENDTYHDGFSKVSKLTMRQNNAAIIDAESIIIGSEGYKRLCSALLVEGYGFEHPVFLTNEEVEDGIVLAIDTANNSIIQMPWLGEFSHENTIHVPYFYNTINKTVVLSFEDGDATESEVYMYISDTPKDLLSGKGQLYVFGAENKNGYNTWNDIYHSNGTVNGEFIPLRWNHSTQNATDLDNEAIAAGAFQFIRPEDGAMDKRKAFENFLYLADTGNDVDESDQPIQVGSNGQNWTNGRIYKFVFTDSNDPTKATFQVMMDGNDPATLGYNFIKNPDNMDTSQKSLMIQEDRIDANHQNVTSPYDIKQNAKIIHVDLNNTNQIEPIAYVNQQANLTSKHGEWESSGILDVSDFFGDGTWLTTVQAHSLKEEGQLLLLNITGS